MFLEEVIQGALKYFGPLNKKQIQQKLKLRGMSIEERDLDHALYLLVINKRIKKSDTKGCFKSIISN